VQSSKSNQNTLKCGCWVLEWTATRPSKASRLIPVSVYDGAELQDGGIYLARPAPLALSSEVEYELKDNGRPWDSSISIMRPGARVLGWLRPVEAFAQAETWHTQRRLPQRSLGDDAQSDHRFCIVSITRRCLRSDSDKVALQDRRPIPTGLHFTKKTQATAAPIRARRREIPVLLGPGSPHAAQESL